MEGVGGRKDDPVSSLLTTLCLSPDSGPTVFQHTYSLYLHHSLLLLSLFLVNITERVLESKSNALASCPNADLFSAGIDSSDGAVCIEPRSYGNEVWPREQREGQAEKRCALNGITNIGLHFIHNNAVQ